HGTHASILPRPGRARAPRRVAATCRPGSLGPAEPEALSMTTDTTPPAESKLVQDELVTTEHELVIGGETVRYRATSGLVSLDREASEDDVYQGARTVARMFVTAYTRTDVGDAAQRPITFAYNGGPGSSSVWLHLGTFGPRRVVMGEEGEPLPAPYRLADNEHSLLDVTDLVFIDPVGTGWSRPAEGQKAKDFHGYQQDLESVGDLIREWLGRENRWLSPSSSPARATAPPARPASPATCRTATASTSPASCSSRRCWTSPPCASTSATTCRRCSTCRATPPPPGTTSASRPSCRPSR